MTIQGRDRPTVVTERRLAWRKPVEFSATADFGTFGQADCTITDLSETGAKLLLPTAVEPLPNAFKLVLHADRSEIQVEVIWARLPEAGVRFTSPLSRPWAKPRPG